MTADPEALFEAAIAYLVGTSVPRSVPDARARFLAAAEMGHTEAALFEVALRANGSGGPVDWPGALALLREVAPDSEVARNQIALLEEMSLDHNGNPLTVPEGEVVSTSPDVQFFRALLSPAECAHVAISVHDLMEPSQIVDPATGELRPDPIRTSAGAVVGPTREDLVIGAINRRFAAVSMTSLYQGEPLSVLHYAPGEQYRAHYDALPNSSNQRIMTLIVYLNQGYQGGETVFPHAGLSLTGQVGDAILFRNVLPDGQVDPRALHAGLPVIHGRKWIATRWIRAAAHDPWTAGGRG